MKKFEYVITDPIGIHARPAGLLVKEAKQFESTITIEKEGKTADVRRLMAVMGMGVKGKDTVTITIEGADEDKAYEAMQKFFATNL